MNPNAFTVPSVADMFCPLSGKRLEDPIELDCRHIFDRPAYIEYMKTHEWCPMCEQTYDREFTDNDVYSVIKKGRLDSLKWYVYNGLDVNGMIKQSRYRNSASRPLIWAVVHKQSEIVEYLIKRGADVNASDGGGWTPLHYVATYPCAKIAQMLVDAGADVDATYFGKTEIITPLYLACSNGFLEIVEILLAAGAKTGRAIIAACNGQHARCIPALIKAGCDVNIVIDNGKHYTALIYAVWYFTLNEVEILVDAGADVDHRDYNNNTPLHHAATRGNSDIVRFLLLRGADPNSVNKNGITPLHVALDNSTDVAEILLNAGADPNASKIYPAWKLSLQYPSFAGKIFKNMMTRSQRSSYQVVPLVEHGVLRG